MVQAAQRKAIELHWLLECRQGRTQRVEVEVAHDDAIPVDPQRLVLGYELYALFPDAVQVVVEGLRGSGRGEGGCAGAQMILERPVRRASTRHDPGQHDWPARSCRTADAARGDLRGGWEHHLHAVLHGLLRVEDENVLGARAHVDREDAHEESVRRASGAGPARC